MKVEELPEIVEKELKKVGYGSTFFYTNFRLASFKKIEGKWHVTAAFERSDVISRYPTTVSIVIDDATGEMTEMTTLSY